MINPYFFIDENIKICLEINLESHKIIHANFTLNVFPSFLDIDIETRFTNKVMEEMATIYARLINQYKHKYHTLFSTSFHKINGEYQKCEETDLFIIFEY